MRFPTISARFGHQFAMFCFDNARLRSIYQKQHIFLSRLLVSVDIGLVCSWVGLAGWDFTISARFGHRFATFVFSRLVFAGDFKNSVFSSTRLLVSVDIGLVCSWVGVAGWDFPPYLRGSVINLQLLFFQCPSLQEISQTVYFFRLDC